ncbi:MAG: GGDEF domain-containing protein [Pseudomonadales bacterium]|nr:GGDEF domain-containing protein [Pseudomonadales bacterium]
MVSQEQAIILNNEPNPTVLADLSETVLFSGVSQEQMCQFVSRSDQAFFEKGEVLLSPEQNAGVMYVLLTGTVCVHIGSIENQPLVKLGSGECVGEMSLFDGNNPSAFVVAQEEVATLVVDSALLWEMINSSHAIARNLLYLLSKRIRSGNAAVTDTQELHKQTQKEAKSDALTGVHNRRWLEELLVRLKGRSVEELAPLSVIMLDVDHFKRFNDNYGHALGDKVLKLVANAMQNSLRPNDMVARYGGEEFVIVLPKTRRKHANNVAERLRNKVAHTPIEDNGKPIPSVTISLGLSHWASGQGLQELIDQADQALYRAKEAGRNQVCE